MTNAFPNALVAAVRNAAQPLAGDGADDRLLKLVGDARVVLLGEASHGTQEFYAQRAALTRRLIAEHGFAAVAVEADWPGAYRVNCYVRDAGGDADADAALSGFKRFPTWMWRNTVVRDFVEWLRRFNKAREAEKAVVGFYGLDLYSLYGSIEAVVGYLDRVDPEAARRARFRYGCFDHFGEDAQAYGYAAGFDLATSCEAEVVEQLRELQRQAPSLAARDGRVAEDEYFYAEQNARLIKNAEDYYRTMFRGRVSSWNVRDCHMADTLDALIAHLGRDGDERRVVVWAHNSHLGDARATEMGRGGELNLGQLARERWGKQVVSIGWSTYLGSVTAARDWGAPAERKRVRPGHAESFEALFHAVGLPRFWLDLRPGRPASEALGEPRLQRAIGVIYRPETERLSHYFDARLPAQFDALIHLDETRALEPLERTVGWTRGEAPETYPSGT